MRTLYIIAGFLSLGIGIIGIFVPLLPTVPLVLLAAFCFARSSERLHNWLITHPRFGPMISDWNESGAIRPPVKRLATLSIALVFSVSLILSVPMHVLLISHE